ncbi:MAG: hypothetical protein KA914_03740 [Ottowia sp.]|nr:hypothetical protein [Ottowia sp.]
MWRSGQPAHYTASRWSRHSSTNAEVIGQWLPVRVRHDKLERGKGVRVSVEPV